MSAKLNIGVVFGGRSVEHEVSIITGYQAIEALDRANYDIMPIYIDRDNVWYIGDELQGIDFFRRDHPPLEKLTRVFPGPDATCGKLKLIEARSSALRKNRIWQVDLALPATHGSFVEDGCLQGLLELAGIPYAGSNVYASAVGMDKLLTKSILKSNNLPCLPYVPVVRRELEDYHKTVCENIEKNLAYPLMIKPARLGSSVGVKSAHTRDELEDALDFALRFGETCLVEKFIENCTEINCSVLDGDPPIPSILEKPLRADEILTFDEKYKGDTKGGKQAKGVKGSKGMAGLRREIPAQIPDDKAELIKNYAVKIFNVIGAGGVARIDFIFEENNIHVNEINTIPGSFSYYLWEHMGRSFTELLDYMIDRAVEVRKKSNRMIYSFESNLLAR